MTAPDFFTWLRMMKENRFYYDEDPVISTIPLIWEYRSSKSWSPGYRHEDIDRKKAQELVDNPETDWNRCLDKHRERQYSDYTMFE